MRLGRADAAARYAVRVLAEHVSFRTALVWQIAKLRGAARLPLSMGASHSVRVIVEVAGLAHAARVIAETALAAARMADSRGCRVCGMSRDTLGGRAWNLWGVGT